jgi:hypothetical protein
MTNADQLAAFSTAHLGGQAAPPDLALLLEVQWNGTSDVLADLGFRFWRDAKRSPLLEMTYLNDNDRANPNTMANVAAAQDVFAFIAFVGEDDDGNAYGYWLGPDHRPIENAPIISYDTEGQFSVRPGRMLAEALLADRFSSQEDEFLMLRDQLNQLGLNISAASPRDLHAPDVKPAPEQVHRERYNAHRVAAGLPPYKK